MPGDQCHFIYFIWDCGNNECPRLVLPRPRTNLVFTNGINADFKRLARIRLEEGMARTVAASEGPGGGEKELCVRSSSGAFEGAPVRSRWARAPVSLRSLGNLQIWKENVKIPGDASDTSLYFKSHHANNGLLSAPCPQPFWGLLTQRKLPSFTCSS